VSDDAKTWIGSVLVFAGIVAYITWVGGLDTVWYAAVYKVSTDQVHVNKKPIDCDYYYAPVGHKGCQYEAVVKAYDKAGSQVGGDGAPIYSHDAKTEVPIISYDDGKTWRRVDPEYDPDEFAKVQSVVVYWMKVED
jgi:hypothetical protein